ncbi:MAG: (deoxy)nucleoside triphosphate pyrophosphohydrolase [Candidatus Sumerlaeia bacterium]|nr:(deoxy)nucleoside triphosphate pyrophosphohydrolase [Candidatus Sumerlaeia bacterium]
MAGDHLFRVVVAGILRRHDGAYLACQRPPGKWGAGKWEFPGGKVEHGESPPQALIRELREELGIEIEPRFLREALTFSYPDRTDSLLLLFLECELASGTLHAREGQEFRWVTPEEALALDWLEADWPIVHQLRESSSNFHEKRPE